MIFDDIDMKVINEMYNKDLIDGLNKDNVMEIYKYLIGKGIYYAKDLFIEYLDLFLIDSDVFINKFDKIIEKLGSNYVDIIGEDSSILMEMYE